jgi:hypothetical protein
MTDQSLTTISVRYTIDDVKAALGRPGRGQLQHTWHRPQKI